MPDSTEAIWERINAQTDRMSEIESRMAAHEARTVAIEQKIDLSRQERTEQFREIKAGIDGIREEVSEYRGALQFGKWLAGILIALGVPAGLLAMWGGHGK